MKLNLKTLVMLNEIRDTPAKIYLCDTNSGKEFEMTVSDYLAYKKNEITDWTYVNGDSEYGDDDVIKVWV